MCEGDREGGEPERDRASAFGTNEFYHIRCCLRFGQIVCHGFG